MPQARDGEPPGWSRRNDGPPLPADTRGWDSVREARATREAGRRSLAGRGGAKGAAKQQRSRQNARTRARAQSKRATVLNSRRDQMLRSWEELRAAAAERRPDLVSPSPQIPAAQRATTPQRPSQPPSPPRRALARAVPPPAPQVVSQRGRPGVGVLLVAAVVLTLVSLGAVARFVLVDQGGEPAGSPQETVGQASTSPEPEGAVPFDTSTAPNRPGGYVRSRMLPNGQVRSDHYLITRQPVDTLTLTSPPLPVGDNGVDPSVHRLRVFADGRPVGLGEQQLGATETQRVDLATPAKVIHLRYVTSGAVQQSPTTSPTSRRALVLVNPLRVQVDVPVRSRVVRLTGADVLSLACATGAASPEPCGRPDDTGRGWQVQQDGSGEVTSVLAQVDLPSG